MSGRVAMMPALSAKNWLMSNVADAMTGLLAHVLADMLPHDCPGISTTHMAITPTEPTVVCLRKNGTYTWINANDTIFGTFSQNHTVTTQFSAKLCCFFFMSKRLSQHVGKILDNVLSTCRLVGTTFFSQCLANIPDICGDDWKSHLAVVKSIFSAMKIMGAAWCIVQHSAHSVIPPMCRNQHHKFHKNG